MRKPAIAAIVVVSLFVLAAISLPLLAELVTDWYWFREVGFETVFLTRLGTQVGLGVVIGVITFAFLYVNLRLAQRGVAPDAVVLRMGQSKQGPELTNVLRSVSGPAAFLLALLGGIAGASGWLMLLRFLERTPFGAADPVFGRDIGYYVFTLPLVATAIDLLFGLALLSLLLVVPLYLLRRDFIVMGRQIRIEPSAQWHLAMLGALLFLSLALDTWFVDLPSLLYSTRGPLVGASYADLTIQAPVLRITAFVALAGAGLVLWGGHTRYLARNAAVAAVLYFGVILLGGAATGAMQRFVVDPNELEKETPQIEHHIAATRAAWRLDGVEIRDLTGEATLSLDDIRRNDGTIRNVRLWDRDPLLQTFGQLQAIRTYYDFVAVDDDRYMIDGVYRQVLLSPRELNSQALPARSFINERFVYTHGMGLTLSPVNQVTAEGLPVLFIEDLPPRSRMSLEVTRPQLYFGELTNQYVFVNTGQREFDYPAGDENAYTNYEGAGGVAVGSMWRRLLFSIRFGSLNIVFANELTEGSRVLYHREIATRARTALPFLLWDSDPYLVVSGEGHLKWMLDAYTTTSRYPYAQPLSDGTTYLRNSVKVVIDAYDGTIDAYVAEPDDPLIRTYRKIFDGIFQPLDSLPPHLRAHLKYPDQLFRVQTALYTTFHMTDPNTFYHREDEWQIPAAERGGPTRDPFLRHIVMKLPGEDTEEFIVMTPFTPRQKDNLAAWMVARMDGEHYGQLVVYRFPRQSLVFGPMQVVNRINQDTEISQQVSLWDQRGSQVIRGNLLVIPIEESLIFVQAIYLRAEGGRIPELKRVVVAYQNRVVMEETLERGLAVLFGGAVETDRRPTQMRLAQLPTQAAGEQLGAAGAQAARVRELISEATSQYQRATQAQRQDDWATYGEAMRRVGELLTELRRLVGTQ